MQIRSPNAGGLSPRVRGNRIIGYGLLNAGGLSPRVRGNRAYPGR